MLLLGIKFRLMPHLHDTNDMAQTDRATRVELIHQHYGPRDHWRRDRESRKGYRVPKNPHLKSTCIYK